MWLLVEVNVQLLLFKGGYCTSVAELGWNLRLNSKYKNMKWKMPYYFWQQELDSKVMVGVILRPLNSRVILRLRGLGTSLRRVTNEGLSAELSPLVYYYRELLPTLAAKASMGGWFSKSTLEKIIFKLMVKTLKACYRLSWRDKNFLLFKDTGTRKGWALYASHL